MIELLTILIIGLIIGWKYREWTAIRYIQKQQEEAERLAQMAGAVADLWIPIKIERTGEQLFCYNGEDGSFMAQGDDHKELAKRLVERFPGKRFTMTEKDRKTFDIHYGDN